MSTDWKCLRLTTILAHHSGAIHNIILSSLPPASRALFKSCGISGHILSCSDDMTVGVVTVRHDGSLMLNKLLHGHVSRVRAIHSQGHHLLSGSDDRSVKLWSLRGYNKKVVGAATNSEKPLATLTGHSGPVTGVLLALPKLAFSAAGCTVRLWDVEAQTCLKLLQHEPDCPVTSMSWISTFQAYMDTGPAALINILYSFTKGRHRVGILLDTKTRLWGWFEHCQRMHARECACGPLSF